MKCQQAFVGLLLVVGFTISPVLSQSGVCERTMYRTVEATTAFPVTMTYNAYDRYRCGFLWLSRCRRSTGIRSREVTKYRTTYRTESYMEPYCCTGFDGSPPDCEIIQCPVLSNPANGDVSHSSIEYSSQALYTCDPGYNLAGSDQRTCDLNGQWSGSRPTCTAITCSTPSNPSNGQVSYTSVRYNGVAHYSCSVGFKIVGDFRRTCRITGVWSRSQPSCHRLMCPDLLAPANGHVQVSKYYPGGQASYSCNIGYRKTGSMPSRVCQNNEMWSGIESSCQEIFCPVLKHPQNGTVKMTSRAVGSMASFSCLDTHDLVGSKQRFCLESGEWNATYSVCREKCVPSIGFKQQSIAIKEGETKRVCIINCYSTCSLTYNITVEIKARSDIDDEQTNTDLLLPSELIVTDDLICFDLTANDDNLIEGYEFMVIKLFRPDDQLYNICQERQALSVVIGDNDELTIGFEEESMTINEGAGSVEICVVVLEPDISVPIHDVVLSVEDFDIGGADIKEDYTMDDDILLPFSDSSRKACFFINIKDDGKFEKNEKFSLHLLRDSRQEHHTEMILDPWQLTLIIIDNDGVSIDFEENEMIIDEGESGNVCLEARFSTPDSDFGFYVILHAIMLNADEDDFSIDNMKLGPFNQNNKHLCVNVNALTEDENDFENRKEYFTLEMTADENVMIEQQTILITIMNKNELVPCRDYPFSLFGDPQSDCTTCTYPYKHQCSSKDWIKKQHHKVDVPTFVCTGEKMYLDECTKNATEGENCHPRVYTKKHCITTEAEELMKDMGTGTSSPTPSKQASSANKRSAETGPAHCYAPDEALLLSPQQCNLNEIPPPCPFKGNEINSRDPKTPCPNRSVLLVVDSSYSVGYDTFRDIAKSLSLFLDNICGNVQFGLLKFSSGAYLEFCFNCYKGLNRDEIQERIKKMMYVGHSSYMGYATKCSHDFMLGSECGNHDGRCIDIVFVTDGHSSDSALIDVCQQVECLHKNPNISSMLKIYAINVGDSLPEEVKCITKYSKPKNRNSTIFHFEQSKQLIGGLNLVTYEIKEQQHMQRKTGDVPKFKCIDWFEDKGFYNN